MDIQNKAGTRGKGIMLNNLKQLRHQAGLTTRELEAKSGVGQNRISRLENGRAGAQGRTVRSLAEALGVSTKELVG